MKKYFRFLIITAAVVLAASFAACSARMPDYPDYSFYPGNEFQEITENPFVLTADQPKSTFSLDCNTAAYSVLRRTIRSGQRPVKDQVRIEEMVNYFSYEYPAPDSGKALSVNGWITDCPWNEDSNLLTVGIRAEEIVPGSVNNNLVFLLDVSGSMNSIDRLGLIQNSIPLILEVLGKNDRVSVVTYASGVRVLLDGERASEKLNIRCVIEELSASGSTAGAGGIQKAYEIAEKNFIEGGNNRVILATDGDFNVGISNTNDLKDFISEKRDTGVYLSVLGVGMGNLKDDKMETLANAGNGNYAYLDSFAEARKVLVHEIGGTLNVVAKDAKAQVEFNPDYVEKYRQLGYENKQLTQEEWEDGLTDAGEIGSGHTVTAVYEVVLTEEAENAADAIVTATVRYKAPSDNSEQEISASVDTITAASGDVKFIACVVETALILRESPYRGSANINAVIARLEALNIAGDQYKNEFLSLARMIGNSLHY